MKEMIIIALMSLGIVSALRADDLVSSTETALKCPPLPAAVVLKDEAVKPKFETTEIEVPQKEAEAIATEVVIDEAPYKELSPTERLKAYRNKLEEKNLLLLQKKMEMIRLQQEMALLRSLERSMDKTLNAIEKI